MNIMILDTYVGYFLQTQHPELTDDDHDHIWCGGIQNAELQGSNIDFTMADNSTHLLVKTQDLLEFVKHPEVVSSDIGVFVKDSDGDTFDPADLHYHPATANNFSKVVEVSAIVLKHIPMSMDYFFISLSEQTELKEQL